MNSVAYKQAQQAVQDAENVVASAHKLSLMRGALPGSEYSLSCFVSKYSKYAGSI